MALPEECDEAKGSERELGVHEEGLKAIIIGFKSEF